MTTITAVIPSVAAPSLSDLPNFEAEAEQLWHVGVPAFVAAANSFGSQANIVAGEMNADKIAAGSSATAADLSKTQAAASASAAAASSGAAVFNAGTSYAIYAMAISPVTRQTYRRNSAGTNATDPSASPLWTRISSVGLGEGGASASGEVTLTAVSVGALAMTPTGYGQAVNLPNATTLSAGGVIYSISNVGMYPALIKNSAGTILRFLPPRQTCNVTLVDSSTSAGVWSFQGGEPAGISAAGNVTCGVTIGNAFASAIAVDGLDFIFFTGAALQAVVWDPALRTLSNVVNLTALNIDQDDFLAARYATNQCLCVYGSGGASFVYARVLSYSAGVLTLNPEATAATSGALETLGGLNSGYRVVQCGSTFVFGYAASSGGVARALTGSGTTPSITLSIGTALPNSYGSGVAPWLDSVNATTFVGFGLGLTSIFCLPGTVSGNALTAGTPVNLTSVGNSVSTQAIRKIGARYLLVYNNTVFSGSVVSVSGSTATASTVALAAHAAAADSFAVAALSDRLIVAASTGSSVTINCLVDSAGTAVAGAAITLTGFTTAGIKFVDASATELHFVYKAPISGSVIASIGSSGNNPAINSRVASGDDTLGCLQRGPMVTTETYLDGSTLAGQFLSLADLSASPSTVSAWAGRGFAAEEKFFVRGGIAILSQTERWILSKLDAAGLSAALAKVVIV